MKWTVSLVIANLFSVGISAQKQADNWNFAHQVSLNFSSQCRPTSLSGSVMHTQEGNATISDAESGELLFYSDAVKVWNRENQPMPNSGDDDPRPGVNRQFTPLSQGALIVPDPGSPSIYYLFSLIEQDPRLLKRKPPGALSYSRIDMRLEEGKGDVILTDKNSYLAEGLVGRLTAVQHANGKDYWLITHQAANNAFLIYPITAEGIGRADTMRIGPVIEKRDGFLKASPDGKKLACSSRGTSAESFDLYDFDASNGQITNHLNLGSIRVGYGVSFSPDNTKLYVSTMEIAGRKGAKIYAEYIRQYNLQAGSAEAIVASGKSIIYQNPFTNINLDQEPVLEFYAPSLQLGPDGRLYCASNANAYLCPDCGYRFFVIEKPNEAGFACEVNVKVFSLPKGVVGNASDLPNFMQHYFNGLNSKDCPYEENDECDGDKIILAPNPANDYFDLKILGGCFTKFDLRIMTMSGQVLSTYEFASDPQPKRINISPLPVGLYMAEIRFKNRVVVKKFFKGVISN